MSRTVKVNDDVMVIETQEFVHKDYAIHNKELLLDIFSKFYTGQQIIVKFLDGENPRMSGFNDFMEFICDQFQIPDHKILYEIETMSDQQFSKYPQKLTPLRIFPTANSYLSQVTDQNLESAKFVGTLIGRLTPARLQLAYAVDQAWPGDNFITFQPEISYTNYIFREVDDLYEQELTWLNNKIFDQDLKSNDILGSINWQKALASYGNICNRFHIEIICETDSLNSGWFTEKTAKCLAIGEPFVLVAGTGALAVLRSQGFKTFGDLIDESYDLCSTTALRISHLIESLKTLYNHPERSELLKLMYQRAAENISVYRTFKQKINQKICSVPAPDPESVSAQHQLIPLH